MILAAFDIYMLINLKNPGLSVINLMVLRSFASDLGLEVNEFDTWVDYTPIFTFHAFLYERISDAFSSEDRSYTELALWCVDFLPDQSSMRGFSQNEWATIIWLYISESLTSDQEPHAYESSNQSLKPDENKWTELECNELTGRTLDYGWHLEDVCEKEVGSAYYDARMDSWKRPMRTEIFERN
ncbi:hypothetical protein M413DRAFT_373686 [Hebeloma cylindrosporum]|uniref:Uncharacterized protein n=1 Tax=Hebeloma cylindrosporum TaxID=76867 RepID=A0A0C2YSM8_HEBCY|nr:hypothetical protein M413DRAFT_373686 [Hebeloma cylindrosporum h7]